MNFKSAILLFSTVTASLAASAEVTGSWVQHPSLNIYSSVSGATQSASQATNNVQKLFDGERYLYALITAEYYYNRPVTSSGSDMCFSTTPVNIARLDKSAAGAKMEPLATLLHLSGTGVDTAEYSQELKCIVVAYDNGTIDIIYDDGRVFSNTDLKNYNIAGGRSIRSVSFSLDGKKAVLAADFGILVLNTEDASTESMLRLGKPVEFANIVGDRMIAADAEAIHFFPASQRPAALDDTPVLKSDADHCNSYLLGEEGNVRLTYGIYPVDDRSFVFAGHCYNNFAGESVNLLVLPEDPDREMCPVHLFASSYVNYTQLGAGELMTHGHHQQSLFSQTRDGLMMHTDANVYLIDYKGKNIDYSDPSGAAEFAQSNVRVLFKDPVAASDAHAGAEKFKTMASHDGENFWIYRHRVGFQPRRCVSTDAAAKKSTWESSGDPAELNAVSAGFPKYIYYNPRFGMVTHNTGITSDGNYANGMADGLCSYRDGEWTQRSLIHTNYANGYMYAGSQVANLPNGAIHDPLDPKYVYTRGRLAGLRRENLEDPTDHLLLTTSQYKTNLPFRVTVVDRMIGSSYSTLCAFSEPGFDADGTMWTTFDRLVHPAYPELHAELWYWTPEDRAACKTAADYASHPMKIINVPGVNPSQVGITLPGRLEKNRNIILHTSDNSVYDSFMYDHNGTLDDTSDDRFIVFLNMIDDNGDETLRFLRPQAPFEDPYDGAFIVGHHYGVFSITKEQAFDYDKPHFSPICPVLEGSGTIIPDFGIGGVGGITADSEGRKWIALKTGGLYCLSPDRKTVLAHFTKENSELPTDELLSVAYNPETNSVFVGSRYGISEFAISGSGHPALTNTVPSVSPRIVEAHYNGYVTFSGLTDSKTYSLVAPDGSVSELPASEEGRLQWHPQGKVSGAYHLLEHPEVEFYLNK